MNKFFFNFLSWFASFLLYCFIYKANIAFARYDQFVFRGCKLKDVNGSVIQECENKLTGSSFIIPEIVFNEPDANQVHIDSAFVGSITGARNVGSDGMYWVQNGKILTNKYELEVCSSIQSIVGVVEECKTIQEGDTVDFNNLGSVELHRVKLNNVDRDGSETKFDLSDGSSISFSTDVHSDGYVFTMFSTECPYSGNSVGDQCIKSSQIKGGIGKENCYLTKDYEGDVCPDEHKCICGTPVQGAKVEQSIVPCDSVFQPVDKGGLSAKTLNCFQCYSKPRIMLQKCLTNAGKNAQVINAYNSENTDVKNLIRGSYGDGEYLCAFVSNGGKRLGCIKNPATIGPRSYPRIARADANMNFVTNPAAHLFVIRPFVEQFRDKETKGRLCNRGDAEIGENSRGTFFRPKIKIKLSDAIKVITFTPRSTDMKSVYGGNDFKEGKDHYSEWNESEPLRFESGKLNLSTCAIETSGYVVYICTRIEMHDSTGTEEYAAYFAPSLSNSPNASSSCFSLESSGMLEKIGSVPRPPIKYGINRDGIPNIPIMLQNTNTDSDKRYPVKVTFNPNIADSVILGYHNNLSSVSDYLTPDHLDPITQRVVRGKKCALMFTHKVCIEEDECSSLDYIDPKTRTRLDLATCSEHDCITYKALASKCEKRTYCNPKYLTVDSCQQYFRPASKVALPGDISRYSTQSQWYPSACISDESFSLPSFEKRKLFGEYGQKNIEYGIELFYDDSYRGRLIRKFERDKESSIESIIAVNSDYFYSNSISTTAAYLDRIKYENGRSINAEYFGDKCNLDCVAKKIKIRKRNIAEMGGCLNFTRASDSIDKDLLLKWMPGDTASSIIKPDCNIETAWNSIYVPLGCRYLDIKFQGTGGGGTGYGIFEGYDNKGTVFHTGGTGGGGRIILDTLLPSNSTDILQIIRHGSCSCGVKSEGIDLALHCTYKGFSCPLVPMGLSVLNQKNEIAFGSKGMSVLELPEDRRESASINDSESLAGKGYISQKFRHLTDGTEIGFFSDEPQNVYLYKDSNDAKGISNQIFIHDGEHRMKNHDPSKFHQILNFWGDDSFGSSGKLTAESSTAVIPAGIGISYKMRGIKWSMTPGHGGGAIVSLPRIKKDREGKQSFTVKGDFDPKCISMCPRVNLETTLNGKKVICEYGGVIANGLGELMSTAKFDNQGIMQKYGMPTHCVDDEGNVYLPSSNMGIQRCSEGKIPYSVSTKLYGVCLSSNTNSEAIKYITTHDGEIEISGSGVYCGKDNSSCKSAIRYWSSDANSNNNISIVPELTDISKYARSCLINGFWSSGLGVSSKTPLKIASPIDLDDENLHEKSVVKKSINDSDILDQGIFCPVIDPTKIPYDSFYSLNAIWPKTPAGKSTEPLKCIDGYIPHATGEKFRRECSAFGTWRGFQIPVSPCLYSCQTIVDRENNIKWDPPASYGVPKSQPVCLPKKVKVYSGGDLIEKEVPTTLLKGSTDDFSRICNMPSRKFPYEYADVSSENPRGVLPHWDPAPPNARCDVNEYKGHCMSSRHVCYDGLDVVFEDPENNKSIGHCMRGYTYTVNGVPISPPFRIVENGVDRDTDNDSSISLVADSTMVQCVIERTQTNDEPQLPFQSFSATLDPSKEIICKEMVQTLYFPIIHGLSDFMFAADIVYKSDTIGRLSEEVGSILMSNIQNDIPIRGEKCKIEKNSFLLKRLEQAMASRGMCSFVCFDDSAQSFTKYPCQHKIPNFQNVSYCKQVCSADPQKIYFSYSTGITTEDPKVSNSWNVSVSNDQSCLDIGIPVALLSLRSVDHNIDLRVGHFCEKVVFSGMKNTKSILSVPSDEPEVQFLLKGYDNTKKACYLPRQCILPTGEHIDDQATTWIGFGNSDASIDKNFKFEYSSVFQPNGSNGQGGYRVSGKNIFLFLLGCSDGNIFLLDVNQLPPYNNFVPKLTDKFTAGEQIDYAIGLNKQALSSKFGIPIESLMQMKVVKDFHSPIGQYLSLPRLMLKGSSKVTDNIIDNVVNQSKSSQNTLKYIPSQIADYKTMGSVKDIEAIFTDIKADKPLKILSSKNEQFKLFHIPSSADAGFLYFFANWQNEKDPISTIQFVDNGWEIFQYIKENKQKVRLGIGNKYVLNPQFILDANEDTKDLQQILRRRWTLLCSTQHKDCVFKNELTDLYISPKRNQYAEVSTVDIGRAEHFKLSN